MGMIAIAAQPVPLFLIGQKDFAGNTAGTVAVVGLDHALGYGGPQLVVQPSPGVRAAQEVRLVALAVEVTGNRPISRRYGRIIVEGQERPRFIAAPAVRWLWLLTPEDLELIERDRASTPGAPLALRLHLSGVVEIDHETWGFAGDTSLSISAGDWTGLLGALGYGIPPSLSELGGGATGHVSWAEAERRLARARAFLRTGEGAEALEAAYHAMESIVRDPYKTNVWDDVLTDLPPEKAAAIRQFLCANGQYLSRLGRHPVDGTPGQPRQLLPLDHWEAELAVAVTQILLTYALRIRGRQKAPGAAATDGPTVFST
jgi:hypothetical protein